jgi:hypothetical protein
MEFMKQHAEENLAPKTIERYLEQRIYRQSLPLWRSPRSLRSISTEEWKRLAA